jgi:hypothetical protein
MAKVFISYTGHAKQDADMAAYFADYLSARHHDIFIQTKIPPGLSWPEVVDTNLREADYLVVLISGQSVQSDMVIEEVRRGARLRQDLGRPVILPVRLGTVEMPYDLGAKVNRIQQLKWNAAGDETTIAEKLEEVLTGKLPPRRPRSRLAARLRRPARNLWLRFRLLMPHGSRAWTRSAARFRPATPSTFRAGRREPTCNGW